MPLKVAVIVQKGKQRSREYVCPALQSGVVAAGYKLVSLRTDEYPGYPVSDIAVFYGIPPMLKQVMADYKAAGLQALYIDLGYWKRRWNGNRYGYHRVSINSRHPTDYFQNVKHPSDRADAVSVRLQPNWKQDHSVVLCGMSQKCAEFEGFEYGQWEAEAISKIRAVTDRRIIYRPKANNLGPNKMGLYTPIGGATMVQPTKTNSIETALRAAWAVVSHHSNAGIDAICHGIPCFCDEGVGVKMGLSDLSLIEQPRYPSFEERRQWVNDIAYCQFNLPEMRNGTMWRILKDDGLIP